MTASLVPVRSTTFKVQIGRPLFWVVVRNGLVLHDDSTRLLFRVCDASRCCHDVLRSRPVHRGCPRSVIRSADFRPPEAPLIQSSPSGPTSLTRSLVPLSASLSSSIMARKKKDTGEALPACARANGYQRGAHREVDSLRGRNKHFRKTKRDQYAVLDLCVLSR